MIKGLEYKIATADVSLFDEIPSQTNAGDRLCLLRIQRELREQGDYVYLEIGSHLGGTIQPHYADSRCRRIYSIDKRPLSQPDERGERYVYPGNSTQTMRDNLKRAFPEADASKLITFDADAGEIDPSRIADVPDFCFIDGEHTDKALISDFSFCLSVSRGNALIATHDSGVVVNGLQEVKCQLAGQNRIYEGLKLGGSVYAIAFGEQVRLWRERLADLIQDDAYFFRSSQFYLKRQRRESRLARWPVLLSGYRGFTALKDWAYRALYKRGEETGRRVSG